MLATAKGYYNGSQIVLDSPVNIQKGYRSIQVLIDTNVILDVLINRKDFVHNAVKDLIKTTLPTTTFVVAV